MEKKEYCRMEDKKCFSVPENAVEVRPAVDIVEEDCGVKIMFEVPGANADTIDVSVAEGILTMRACSTLKRNGFPVCYQRYFQPRGRLFGDHARRGNARLGGLRLHGQSCL